VLWSPLLRALAFAGAVALTGLVGLADYLTGVEISFSIFYLIPVSLAAWFLGRPHGLVVALAGATVWFINDSLLGGQEYSHGLIPYWNALARLGVFSLVSIILAQLSAALQRERQASQELALSYAALDGLRKQQLLIKDQLLSNVSHELRTPLTAVHRFVTLLTDGLAGELEPQQREVLALALQHVDQLARMIQDLLDATRADAGKLEIEPRRVLVEEISAEVIRTLRSRADELGIALEAEISEDLPAVLADPARVRQILFNLLDNALKSTPKEGRVTIRARLRETEPGFACIAVSDTGRGIHPEAQVEIFQRLHQGQGASATSRQGLGLGLYIARELVTRQGGRIWVESQPGRGSTFSFTLPVAEAPEHTPGP
jgi:signal transduction histidine kinase